MSNQVILFDVEGNDLFPAVTRIWCLVAKDLHTGQVWKFREHQMRQAVDLLNGAHRIVAHNGLEYDKPALEKVLDTKITTTLIDTLRISRMMYPDLFDHPIGSNSLEDYGIYFGFPKTEFHDFSQWSQEMENYCTNDVLLLEKIYRHLVKLNPPRMGTQLEHDVCEMIMSQVANGFGFNEEAARRLHDEMTEAKLTAETELQMVFPPAVVEMKTKIKYVPFNPGSRKQIVDRFQKKYGWKPKEYTKPQKRRASKKPFVPSPKMDESVLSSLDFPECPYLLDYFLIEKRMGQLQSWIDACKNGKVHGGVNTNGCVTGRMSHSDPNMAQVPRIQKNKNKEILYGQAGGWGFECRSLFGPTRPGWKQVGWDASGLELRMLAHFLAPYDGGAYCKIVDEGDVHSFNQAAASLDTRDEAKTFIYALIYGAGDEKLGSIAGKGAKHGALLRERFETKIDGFTDLKKAVRLEIRRKGYLVGLDGRPLPVRSDHSALNTRLQSGGAVVMKCAGRANYNLQAFKEGRAFMMANIHDEIQTETCEDPAVFGPQLVDGIKTAEKELGIRCPLKGEWKCGNNWAETH